MTVLFRYVSAMMLTVFPMLNGTAEIVSSQQLPPQAESKAHSFASMYDPWMYAGLSPERYCILRKQGTERPFTGRYLYHNIPGTYRCAGCGLPVFSSEAKYDAGTGWPSFKRPINGSAVIVRSYSPQRSYTEVVCSQCDCHLGDHFDNDPKTNGERFCINSLALDFAPPPGTRF